MSIFKKKKIIKSVTSGQLISLNEVKDQVFSKNMMGTGFAIAQHSGQVFSPIAGKILSIFPTRHAITIETIVGDKLFIHMGLDTVELKGEPFLISVKEGDMVTCGQLIAEMDIAMIEKKEKDTTIVVVLPEVSKGKVSKKKQVTIEDDVFVF
ncbi:PTS sugar transporter subunit IIA [Enterococcus sp. LJL99]